jgi:hypothetical protein
MEAAQRGWFEFSGRWLCWGHLLSGAKAYVAAGAYGFFPRNGFTSGAFVCGVAAVDRSLQMRSGGLHIPRRRPAGILGSTKLNVAASVRPKIVPAILRSARAGSARRAFDHRSARREAGGRHRSRQSDAALLRGSFARNAAAGAASSFQAEPRIAGLATKNIGCRTCSSWSLRGRSITEIAAKAKPRGLRRRSPRDPPILMRLLPNLPIAVGQD